jgi:2-desacetyl-2-hydroxyethyl bacteriochlorophyllide A dehydrogenase
MRRPWRSPASRGSLSVAFTGKDRVALVQEAVRGPKRGHVLVKTRCSLISTGTERTCLERRFAAGTHWDRWVQYPFHPGYSCVGIVEEIGKGVTDFLPGDRVASHGPHAQYVLVSESDPARVPDGISDEEAAWFAIACIVQIGFRNATVDPGGTTVIIGTGVLGQLAVQYARKAGADDVIAVGGSRARLKAAAAHGASHIIEQHAREAVARVHDLTEGRGADLVVDLTGNGDVLADALRMAKASGSVILLGDSGFPEEQRLTADLLRKGLTLVGAHFGNASPSEHVKMAQEFFRSVQRGELRVADLITDRVDAREAVKVYARLCRDQGATVGVLLDWTQL